MKKNNDIISNYLEQLFAKKTTLSTIKEELKDTPDIYNELMDNLEAELIYLTEKEIKLSSLAEKTGLNENEILGMIFLLKEDGINISRRVYSDGIELQYLGDIIPTSGKIGRASCRERVWHDVEIEVVAM